jgi:hypothetical protein
MLGLPFDVVKRAPLAVKLATIKLCKSCSYRMFTLPKYAVHPKSLEKYELFWKNRSILSSILGDEKIIDAYSQARAAMLMCALMKPKKRIKNRTHKLPTSENKLEELRERAVLPVLTSAKISNSNGGNPAGNASPLEIGRWKK